MDSWKLVGTQFRQSWVVPLWPWEHMRSRVSVSPCSSASLNTIQANMTRHNYLSWHSTWDKVSGLPASAKDSTKCVLQTSDEKHTHLFQCPVVQVGGVCFVQTPLRRCRVTSDLKTKRLEQFGHLCALMFLCMFMWSVYRSLANIPFPQISQQNGYILKWILLVCFFNPSDVMNSASQNPQRRTIFEGIVWEEEIIPIISFCGVIPRFTSTGGTVLLPWRFSNEADDREWELYDWRPTAEDSTWPVSANAWWRQIEPGKHSTDLPSFDSHKIVVDTTQ